MPLVPGNSPYRLSKLQFSCTITTTWLSLFNPLALAAIAAGALVGAIAVAAAGMAGVAGATACGLPPHAARMGSTSASNSSGEMIFHRVKRFIRSFLLNSVSKYSDVGAAQLLLLLAPDAGDAHPARDRRASRDVVLAHIRQTCVLHPAGKCCWLDRGVAVFQAQERAADAAAGNDNQERCAGPQDARHLPQPRARIDEVL